MFLFVDGDEPGAYGKYISNVRDIVFIEEIQVIFNGKCVLKLSRAQWTRCAGYPGKHLFCCLDFIWELTLTSDPGIIVRCI